MRMPSTITSTNKQTTTSLSVVDHHPTTGGGGGINSRSDGSTASSTAHPRRRRKRPTSSHPSLDFCGHCHGVKDLFTLPYRQDSVNVAIHNVGGTLVLDRVDDVVLDEPPYSKPPPPMHHYQNHHPNDTTRLPEPQRGDHHHHHSLLQQQQQQQHPQLQLVPRLEDSLAIIDNNHNNNNEHTDTNSGNDTADHHNDSLALVNSLLFHTTTTATTATTSTGSSNTTNHHPPVGVGGGGVGAPHDNSKRDDDEPREYLPWQFQDMQLLVGSEALVFNNNNSTNTQSSSSTSDNNNNNNNNALTVRVEDATQFQAWARQHHHDYQQQQQQQAAIATKKRLSYAQAATTTATTSSSSSLPPPVRTEPPSPLSLVVPQLTTTTPFPDLVMLNNNNNNNNDNFLDHNNNNNDPNNSRQLLLQPLQIATSSSLSSSSCPPMIFNNRQNQAAPSVGTTGTCSTTRSSAGNNTSNNPSSRMIAASSSDDTSTAVATTTTTTPRMMTVLDTYLDNIMANVPQLALCLQDKGLIQSVKLLSTEDIPTRLLHPSTADTSVPFSVVSSSSKSSSSSNHNNNTNAGGTRRAAAANSPSDEDIPAVFSPEIMEMNAATLLHFLQDNCTKDSTTYLVRRPSGSMHIQLYNVTSMASQSQQRQWIWRLAMMSYKFAHRLGHIAKNMNNDDDTGVVNNNNNGSAGSSCYNSAGTRRAFRARQRSLWETTLELLENLSDQGGCHHESLIAATRELLADTYLQQQQQQQDDNNNNQSNKQGNNVNINAPPTTDPTAMGGKSNQNNNPTTTTASAKPNSTISFLSSGQPFASSSVDSLTKAQNHVEAATRVLWPLMGNVTSRRSTTDDDDRGNNNNNYDMTPRKTRVDVDRNVVFRTSESMVETAADSEDDDNNNCCDDDGAFEKNKNLLVADDPVQRDAVATQLFGLHHKLVNIDLRLTEIHLRNYYSSSAMRAIRESARHLAKAIFLSRLLFPEKKKGDKGDTKSNCCAEARSWQQQQLRTQYAWLWECCGHFARSFASDALWRERGHASGDDIIIVLRDAQEALVDSNLFPGIIDPLSLGRDSVLASSRGLVHLSKLSGLVRQVSIDSDANPLPVPSIQAALSRLEAQGLLVRDQRQVLVSASIAYSKATRALEVLLESPLLVPTARDASLDPSLLQLLQKRLGDSCNETGKVLLEDLRNLLASLPAEKKPDDKVVVAEVLLVAAEFWFLLGVEAFTGCGDACNLALLRCNICQCYKLRANALFASATSAKATRGPSHAEVCLEKAANQLEMAHATMGNREIAPGCWDMVSKELAATFLVLGVRRRQSLLGSGNVPVVFQALRLSPGEETAIVEPMERALSIYVQSDPHQAAAAHYQLALFFAKVWTCQRDENKTKEKLAAAFHHYCSAHAYFSQNISRNEATFCLLCMDLAGLYAVVSGEEGLVKAVSCCLDASAAFARPIIELELNKANTRSSWMDQMHTLATSVEDRLFKYLRNLVKENQEKYKQLYKIALAAKMSSAKEDDHSSLQTGESKLDESVTRILEIHAVLVSLKKASLL